MKIIATKNRISSNNFIGLSRRSGCIWEKLERVVNNFLREISIVGRIDKIAIALDDDKVWLQTSGKNNEDDFNLRRVIHVRDNRKGFVGHTAVSATNKLLLGFHLERKEERATEVFKSIFLKMFPSAGGDSDGLPDLHGVTNHSDRGYTIANTMFGFMVPSGCDFNNTVKRIPPFPFIWGMKVSDNDPRQVLDEKGYPALFVKQTVKSHRLVTCSAFRTGTKNISAVLSTIVHGHQWEGVCLCPKQKDLYEKDPEHGLDAYFFPALAKSSSLFEVHGDSIESMLTDLVDNDIQVITLEQGTADWHKARQFSMTSSQASFAFRKAFIIVQTSEDWCKVNTYLHGEKYYERKYLFLFSSFLFIAKISQL